MVSDVLCVRIDSAPPIVFMIKYLEYRCSKMKVIIIIGVKHDFLCINICRAPREMLKPEPERQGFRPLPRGPVDVNVSEKHV